MEMATVGAPEVWICPNWSSYPIIEDYYGSNKSQLFSPTNQQTEFREERRNRSRRKTEEDHQFFSGEEKIRQWEKIKAHHNSKYIPQVSNSYTNGDHAPQKEQFGIVEQVVCPHANPQCGGGEAEMDTIDSSKVMLSTKLDESLKNVADALNVEEKKYERLHNLVFPKQPSFSIWSFLCGAQLAPVPHSYFDGLDKLRNRICLALHKRKIEQLETHRKYLISIWKIIGLKSKDTKSNRNFELSPSDLTLFESTKSMLNNDINVKILKQQSKWLKNVSYERKHARFYVYGKNGEDVFQSKESRTRMMNRLLEAVSWFRLVKSQEESNIYGKDQAGLNVSNTEQRLQSILDVLSGEEFFEDYFELMCKEEWWSIAQAHFENLIFAVPESKLCRLLQRTSLIAVNALIEMQEVSSNNKKLRATSTTTPHPAYSASMNYKRSSLVQCDYSALGIDLHNPEDILQFLNRLNELVRKEFHLSPSISKSLDIFIQRVFFPRFALSCFPLDLLRDHFHKEKRWRKRQVFFSKLPLDTFFPQMDLKLHCDGAPYQIICQRIRSRLPVRVNAHQVKVYFLNSIDAFSRFSSIVPYDLLQELMFGVIVLHSEAEKIFGTTHFSVEVFFPLIVYVLVHSKFTSIFSLLHLVENFAITSKNLNGEESYYVYCIHAAVEYIFSCQSITS